MTQFAVTFSFSNASAKSSRALSTAFGEGSDGRNCISSSSCDCSLILCFSPSSFLFCSSFSFLFSSSDLRSFWCGTWCLVSFLVLKKLVTPMVNLASTKSSHRAAQIPSCNEMPESRRWGVDACIPRKGKD